MAAPLTPRQVHSIIVMRLAILADMESELNRLHTQPQETTLRMLIMKNIEVKLHLLHTQQEELKSKLLAVLPAYLRKYIIKTAVLPSLFTYGRCITKVEIYKPPFRTMQALDVGMKLLKEAWKENVTIRVETLDGSMVRIRFFVTVY